MHTAYAAGLFDGEGYVFVCTSRGRFVLRVGIEMASAEPLRQMANKYGGSFYKMSRPKQRRQMYAWQTQGVVASAFLSDVLPFLLVKHEQAELALEFQSTRRTWANGITYKRALQELRA